MEALRGGLEAEVGGEISELRRKGNEKQCSPFGRWVRGLCSRPKLVFPVEGRVGLRVKLCDLQDVPFSGQGLK